MTFGSKLINTQTNTFYYHYLINHQLQSIIVVSRLIIRNYLNRKYIAFIKTYKYIITYYKHPILYSYLLNHHKITSIITSTVTHYHYKITTIQPLMQSIYLILLIMNCLSNKRINSTHYQNASINSSPIIKSNSTSNSLTSHLYIKHSN